MLQNLNLPVSSLPDQHDYEGLRALAAAAASQLVPPILCDGLRGHYLSLRVLAGAAGAVPKVGALLKWFRRLTWLSRHRRRCTT